MKEWINRAIDELEIKLKEGQITEQEFATSVHAINDGMVIGGWG